MIHRYSSVQAAYKCLAYFKHLYIDKVAEPGARSLDLSFGTAIHSAIEAALSGEDGLEMFRHFWDSEQGKDRTEGRYSWARYSEIGEVFISRFVTRYAKKLEPLHLELPLKATLEHVQIEGTLDFVGNFNGKMSVVDFKTSASPYPKEKLIVGEQMPLYHVAYEAMFPDAKKIEQYVYLVFVKGPEPRIQTLAIDVSQVDYKRTVSNLLETCRDLDQRANTPLSSFPQNRSACVSAYGRLCPFFKTCHGGKHGSVPDST